MAGTLEKTSIKEHVTYFSETLGPRPVASPTFHQAADYVRQHFEQAGLALDEIEFDCVDWHHRKTVLEVGGEELSAAANMFSPACDVAGELVAVGTLPELEAADITGKIIVFYGNLSASPLIPINCKVYNAERDQRINQLLADRKPAAVIAVNVNPPNVEGMIEDADLLVPNATVTADVGMRLVDLVGETARLVIDAERRPGTSTTIVGRKVGPTDTRVTIMAHFDSKYETPGAWDNASGMAVMFALADRLTKMDLQVGLEFIAFGDHEYYAYSDINYVEKHGEQMADILLAINFDGIGMQLGSNNISHYSSSEGCQMLLEGVKDNYPGVVWTAPWPQSNHSTFAWRGVPSIAYCSDGMFSVHHQPGDTAEWISEHKLGEVANMVVDIVRAIQDKSPDWTRSPAQ